MIEIWKDIIGYEGLYQISDCGNARSLNRIVKRRNFDMILEGKLLTFGIGGNGYRYCNLCKFGKATNTKIHKLVMAHFPKENPYKFTLINHIDENKLNNHHKNLEWANFRINTNHSANKRARSKYPGVDWNKPMNKWRAACRFNKKKHHLGYFDDELDAAQAYVDFCNKNNLIYKL